MNPKKTYITILKEELKRRQTINPRYSLRAFAKYLDLSPSRLSSIFAGRYGLSLDAARYIGERLGYAQEQVEVFCDLVTTAHARSKKERIDASRRVKHLRIEISANSIMPALTSLHNRDAILWGTIEYSKAAELITPYGLVPIKASEKLAIFSLQVKASYDRSKVIYHEYGAAIWFADAKSTGGYGMHLIENLTDQPEFIQAKREALRMEPSLSGKISLDLDRNTGEAFVEGETGRMHVALSFQAIPKSVRPFKRKFSMICSSVSNDEQLIRSRVSSTIYFRTMPFDSAKHEYRIREGSKLLRFLEDASFRPTHWQFSTSKYDFFRVEGSKN